ncbi:MAG: hypothetical protein RLZZ22_93 [Pseudomonadota bacterium]|jgi:general secretion pathway protein M
MSTSLNTRWQAWLATRAPRERLILRSAVWLLLLALLWSLAIAPAWRILRAAPGRQAVLVPQLHAMRAMATEATTLRQSESSRPPGWSERLRALEATTQRLLKDQAQLSPSGEQVTVTLRDATPAALAQWLQDIRVNARLRPTRVQLERSGPAGAVRWQGQLVLGDPNGAGT